jgi:hypothetical protein
MGDRYGVGLQQSATSTVDGATATDAVGELLGTTAVRGRIYDLLFGHGSAAGDVTLRWEVARATTSATGSAAQGNALDLDAPTPEILPEEEVTVGPTVTADAQVLDFDLNQRATFRWVAAPNGEILIPASATAAVFFNASHTGSAVIARITAHWEE